MESCSIKDRLAYGTCTVVYYMGSIKPLLWFFPFLLPIFFLHTPFHIHTHIHILNHFQHPLHRYLLHLFPNFSIILNSQTLTKLNLIHLDTDLSFSHITKLQAVSNLILQHVGRFQRVLAWRSYFQKTRLTGFSIMDYRFCRCSSHGQ